MRIKNLLFVMMALPLLFVACKENNPVDEVKNPTVEVTAGEATENSLTFTVSSTEATNVAWLCIEATEEVPAAAVVLQVGNAVEANKAVECLANALEENTEYTIVAVAKNAAGAVTKELKMTTKELDAQTPSIKLKSGEASFEAAGGEGKVEYEIINAVPNGKFSHACKDTWVKDIVTGDNAATFTVEANDGEARETEITIFYEQAKAVFKVKQAAKAADEGGDEGSEDEGDDTTDADINFTASLINITYYDMVEESVAYNYNIILSDTPLSSQGMPNPSVDGTYYMLDLYAADQATEEKGIVPNGTYKLNDNLAAGTFSSGDYGWARTFKGGEDTLYLYAEGTVVVSDGKIVADITMEDGSKHHVVYTGSLSWGGYDDEGGSSGPSVPEEFEATHTATKWFGVGQDPNYGFKYAVAGEGVSLDVFFPAKYAQQNALAAGEYIWTTTTMFGYNDFENEFTTKTHIFDGVDISSELISITAGKALVEVEGDVYHIELTLLSSNNQVYMIQFDGKLNDAGTDDGGESGDEEPAAEVVFTKMDLIEYISIGVFKYKLYNDNNDYMLLFVNDYQATATYINSDDSYEWNSSRSMACNLGYFATDMVKVGGEPFTPTAGSMAVLTDTESRNMSISITLTNSFQEEQVFTFNGKIGGDDNTGDDNTGGDNTGDDNTGDDNTGDDNTGDDNTGDDNTGGVSYENWAFTLTMSDSTFTLTDGTHTVSCVLTNTIFGRVGVGTYYINDTTGVNYATDVKVNGVDATSASGTFSINNSFALSIDATIDGIKYTGTSTNTL